MDSRTPDELADELAEALEETRRVRTRKARRSPGRILGIWARLALLGLACAVLLTVAVAIVAKAIRPYQQGRELRAQLALSEQQLSTTRAQNVEYKNKLDYLKTPQGVATEARKLGYVRPGEIPVVLADQSQAADTDSLSSSPKAVPPPSLGQRLHHFVQSLFARRSP